MLYIVVKIAVYSLGRHTPANKYLGLYCYRICHDIGHNEERHCCSVQELQILCTLLCVMGEGLMAFFFF